MPARIPPPNGQTHRAAWRSRRLERVELTTRYAKACELVCVCWRRFHRLALTPYNSRMTGVRVSSAIRLSAWTSALVT